MKPSAGIAYFLSHPIQYFSPLFRSLDKAVDLHVFYYSRAGLGGYKDVGFGKEIKWDVSLLDGYSSSFLKNYSISKSVNNRFLDVINPGVIGALWRSRGKVFAINGWSYSSDIAVMLLGKFLGKEVWMRAENPLDQDKLGSPFKRFLKKLLLKHFIFRFFVDKGLYIGSESKKFFIDYGFGEDDLVYTPYAVDNAMFQEKASGLIGEAEKMKMDLGIPANARIILFSGKYIPKKRPLDLLKAFSSIGDGRLYLVMVGEGELRGQMEDFIRSNHVKNVVLTGFVNQSEIPRYYAAADVFVMCSGIGETWGLAVNEAMNFSKPVVVSDTCGCSKDLVENGVNGYVFPEGDVEELKICISNIIYDSAFITTAGQRSLEIVNRFSIEKIVGNMEAAAKKIR